MNRVLVRWFVQYNPLYPASALCMLAGVFLVAHGLQADPFSEVWLSAVLLVYDVALIAAAAALYRRGQVRPAAILALLEALYLGDPTFQTEQLGTLAPWSLALSLLWVLLFLGKAAALVRALRLRVPRTAWLVVGAGALAVALPPWLMQQGWLRVSPALVAVLALGVPLMVAGRHVAARITSREPLDAAGTRKLARAMRAVWGLWGYYLLHHMTFCAHGHDLSIFLTLVAFFLWSAALARRFETMTFGLVGAFGFALILPPAVAPIVALCALVLAWQARALAQPALYVAAVVAAWLVFPLQTTSQVVRLQPAPLWANLALAVVLGVLAWRYRLRSALVLLASGVALALLRTDLRPALSALQWGVLLVASAFTFLGLGVWLSWRPR